MVVEQGQMVVPDVPFVVESTVPARFKLWGRFAQQAAMPFDVDILSIVYRGFWWEKQALTWYGYVISSIEYCRSSYDCSPSLVARLVEHLDLLVQSLNEVLHIWASVIDAFAMHEGVYSRYIRDAQHSLSSVSALRDGVCEYAMMLCSQWGFAVPEHLLLESSSPTVPAIGEGAESL